VIDAAVDRFVKDGRATALRSVHEMSTTAYKSMEITDRGILRQLGTGGTDLDRANGPRQGFPSTYLANGYVDVLSTSFIQDTGLLHGDRVLPFITPLALEVDTIDDFDLLEYHLARHPKLADQLFS
jgi:N-acylneuraminate cytidylyltransferase